MRFPKHIVAVAAILLLAVILAACGNASGAPSNGPYGSHPASGTTPTASTSGSVVVIHSAMVSVKGKSMAVLTTDKGMTLYYLKADTSSTVACSGGCAQTWPPLLQTGSGQPSGPSSLPGQLRVVQTANGSQVEYNGHPLYTFSGDTAPGQANGEGVKNVWFVATPDLQQQQGSRPYGY